MQMDRIVTSHKAVACKYLRGWFIIDLAAAIPFDLIASGAGGQGGTFAKLLKLPRLLRAMRIMRVIKALPFHGGILSMVEILQMLSWCSSSLTGSPVFGGCCRSCRMRRGSPAG